MSLILGGAAAIALGTWLGAPTASPIVAGLVMGLLWPRQAPRRAAAAGLLAWGALLLAAAVRGDTIGALSASLGGAMGLPPWALPVATLLYPAILASSAAWLAHLVVQRRATPPDAGPATARGPSPT